MCVVATYVIMHVIFYFGVCGNVMCVVATYVIMHVIVYFGVCKWHMCSSHLCNWMFNLVMQPCPYKCVYIYVVVLYAIPTHNTHILLAAIVCVIIGLHTHF